MSILVYCVIWVGDTQDSLAVIALDFTQNKKDLEQNLWARSSFHPRKHVVSISRNI